MKVLVEQPPLAPVLGHFGSPDRPEFVVLDPETGERFGSLRVSADGLEWRMPGMVGGRLMPWRNFATAMTDNDEDRIERLVGDCGLPRPRATALVRSGGRCEYCGRDLLRDRFGYGTGVVDHLLPASRCAGEAVECEFNWVLCCAMCSGAKDGWSPAEDMPAASMDDLRERRNELLSLARVYIYNRLATTDDPAWLRVLAVMGGRDTE